MGVAMHVPLVSAVGFCSHINLHFARVGLLNLYSDRLARPAYLVLLHYQSL